MLSVVLLLLLLLLLLLISFVMTLLLGEGESLACSLDFGERRITHKKNYNENKYRKKPQEKGGYGQNDVIWQLNLTPKNIELQIAK